MKLGDVVQLAAATAETLPVPFASVSVQIGRGLLSILRTHITLSLPHKQFLNKRPSTAAVSANTVAKRVKESATYSFRVK